jgi:hypothetical protein
MIDGSMNTKKENTWRTLQGLKPIQPLKCRLGWHRWTSFEYFEGDFNIGRYDHARCHCADCGLPRIEYPVSLLDKKKKNAN